MEDLVHDRFEDAHVVVLLLEVKMVSSTLVVRHRLSSVIPIAHDASGLPSFLCATTPSPSAPIRPPSLPATQNEEVVTDYRIATLENRIAYLGIQLEQAKTAAQTWVDASSSLSCNAAEARAKNQGAGGV